MIFLVIIIRILSMDRLNGRYIAVSRTEHYFRSDVIITAGIFIIMFKNILQCNAVKKTVCQRIKFFPYVKGIAPFKLRAVVHLIFQT